ncbi:MAG TPA: MFS transporter [Casimicrobiaceae bacterium]|nr:MFS transporter [Casimicrobiaceae bacterium]
MALRGMAATPRELQWIVAARTLRAFGDGFVSLLLPAYLLSLGYSAFVVGVIATATLLGSGVFTLGIGLHAHRFRSRTLLLGASALMAATGVSFATLTDLWPLLLVAIVGTLNPSAGDVSVFMPLEHATIARLAPASRRTAWFARYSLTGALAAAIGAACAGVPQWLATHGMPMQAALSRMFLIYAALGIACALCYHRLPRDAPERADAGAALVHGRRVVHTLAALFSLDAFAGGLIVQSMLALWLFERFELAPAAAGLIFFWTGVLSALSYLVAVRIADRFGLVNTMVFTHLPSSVLLILVPFAPTLTIAVALLLARSALSQMDVPTRSAFVMSVVLPAERAAAASVTAVPRSLAAAVSPMLAGWLLVGSSFGWPLVCAGVLKIAYDLLLLAVCRNMPTIAGTNVSDRASN